MVMQHSLQHSLQHRGTAVFSISFDQNKQIKMETMQVKRAAAAIIITELLDDEDLCHRRGKTREWIKRREEKGAFSNIVKELGVEAR